MTTIRRRVLRPERLTEAVDIRHQRCSERRRQQLDANRRLLRRWLTRLFRASHTVERLQARIARGERQVAADRVSA